MRTTPVTAALFTTLLTWILVPAPAAAKLPAKPSARHYVAIAKQKISECPVVSGWSAAPVFPPAKHALMPSMFRRFCRYTSNSPAKNGTFPKFPAGDFARADPDYDILLPQGDTLDNTLYEAFRVSHGLAAKKQRVYQGPYRSRLPMVAIVDTVGPGKGPGDYGSGDAHTRHGLAMARILQEVRCPGQDEACRVEPNTGTPRMLFFNAFRRTDKAQRQQAPAVDGSSRYLGSLGTLATAIATAVSTWREVNGVDGTRPLVLNLSLGWDPAWTGETKPLSAWDIPAQWLAPDGTTRRHRDLLLEPSPDLPATAQAVHAALVYASCFDVLTIAAAGNNTAGGCEQTGGTAPGRWEKLLAPERALCAELFGDSLPSERPGNGATKSGRRALVYAAGARHTSYWVLAATSQVEGRPPRYLAATHAVASAGGTKRTDPWSGSSVAAAALSGLAANLWSHDLRLSSHDVMALIDDSGDKSTGSNAYYGTTLTAAADAENPPGWTPPVLSSNVSANEAFLAMCAHAPTSDICKQNPYVKRHYPSAGYLRKHFADGPASSSEIVLTAEIVPTQCGVERMHYYPTGGMKPPLSAHPAAFAWTRPQPDTPLCPMCPIKSGRLHIELDPGPAQALDKQGDDYKLDNPVLEFRLHGKGYDHFIAVSLGPIAVPPGGRSIDLNGYRIDVNGTPMSVPDAIEQRHVWSATLTVFAQTSDGKSGTLVSVIPII